MKNLIIILAFFVSLGSSLEKSETRELTYFNRINVSAGIVVELIKSDRHFVEVEVEGAELEELETEINKQNLTIGWEEKGWFSSGWGNNKSATVTVYYTELSGFDISSGSIVKGKEVIVGNEMDIDASSGAILTLQIDCKNLEVDVSSGAIITLEGVANFVEAKASSGAILEGENLMTNAATMDGSSGAILKIHTIESIEAEVSSGAIVKYKGNPAKKDLDAGEWSGGVIKKMD